MNWIETELNIFIILLYTYPVHFGVVFVAGMLATVVIKKAKTNGNMDSKPPTAISRRN